MAEDNFSIEIILNYYKFIIYLLLNKQPAELSQPATN